MEHLLRDLRYASRILVRKPAFTAVAVLSLGLGIGANATVFSIVNELFLRPLPIENPERMVAVYTVDERNPGLAPLSHLNWRDLRDDNKVFSEVVGYDWATLSVAAGDEPTFVVGQLVSGNYFDALGVDMARGRAFAPEEDETPGTHPVAVLSHGFWTRQLGADPAVLESTLRVNDHPFTVVGVASPEFNGVDVGVAPDLWIPMTMNRVIKPDEQLNWYDQRRGLFIQTVARLKPGVTVEKAGSNLRLIGERLEREYPDDNDGRSFELRPLTEAAINPNFRGGLVDSMWLLGGIVGLVLLIACANVANLLLARAAERRREIATRLALGASRNRLISQLVTESVVVSLLGGALGLLLAYWAKSALLAVLPNLPVPVTLDLRLDLDARVLLFTFGLALLTGLFFGLVPALQSTRPGLVAAIKDPTDPAWGGGRKLNVRNLLVVGQVALSLVALTGAGLFIRSLGEAQEIDPGFETERALVVSVDVGLQGYDRPRGEQFFRDLVERTESLPGVASAAVAQGGPLQPTISRSLFLEGGGDRDRTFVQVNVVGTGYFETLGIPVVKGRPFTEVDRRDSVPVVIVNETMAEKFWPGEDPLGKRFTFFGFERPVEVVGVARDVKYNALGEDPMPYAYQPLAQQYSTGMTLVVRTDGAPEPVLETVRSEIRAMDPQLPQVGVGTVSQRLRDALWGPRIGASMLAAFGLLALVLAAIGLYGVMSYSVQRRRREIGIRMALGAERSSVLRLVLRQALGLVAVGLAVGLALALLASKGMASLLFVSPTDPVAFGVTLAVLLSAALLASFLPAQRASGVDPIKVLRHE